MQLINDFRQFVNGNYLTVSEIAHSFEISESVARENLNELVSDDILRQTLGERYVVADDVDTNELTKNFNQQFSEYRDDLRTSVFEF